MSTAVVSVLGLASCAQDETVGELQTKADNAISFRPAFTAQTRASEINNSNLSEIYVTGFMPDTLYFHDVKFSKGSDGYFNSLTKYLFPADNTNIQFYAYWPSQDVIGDLTTEDNNVKLESYVTPDQIADQVDFITANATGNQVNNAANGVALDFKHRFAQVEVRAKSDNKDLKYVVAGVRIGRPQTTGTFDFASETWTLDDWHETSVWTSSCTPVTLSSDPVSVMGESGNGMFIPQTLTPWSPTGDPDNVAREAYISILVRITSNEGVALYPWPSDTMKDANGNKRQYAWASIPLSGTWEQGKKYIYTLDLTDGAGNIDPDDPNPGEPVLGDPIKFTVNVEDWVDAPISDPMVAIKK